MPNLKAGQKAPHSRVYVCSSCKHRSAILRGETAHRCPNCNLKTQFWKPTEHVLLFTTKNVKEELDRATTVSDKIADGITLFCGSMAFVYVHIIWFSIWIFYNLGSSTPFDPFPFGFLVLIVSLEAIVLATFILVSQNRENEVNALRAQLDYEVDLKSAKMLAEIRSMFFELTGKSKKLRRYPKRGKKPKL